MRTRLSLCVQHAAGDVADLSVAQAFAAGAGEPYGPNCRILGDLKDVKVYSGKEALLTIIIISITTTTLQVLQGLSMLVRANLARVFQPGS